MTIKYVSKEQAVAADDAENAPSEVKILDRKTFQPLYFFPALLFYIGMRFLNTQQSLLKAACCIVPAVVMFTTLERLTAPPSNSVYNFLYKRKGRDSPLKRPTLVCIGDSLTHARVSANWVDKILPEIHARISAKRSSSSSWSPTSLLWVVNNGQNSMPSFTAATERVDWALQCEPDYVVLLAGTNDARGILNSMWNLYQRFCWSLPCHSSVESVKQNLSEAIEKLLKAKPSLKIALCTLPPIGEDLNSCDNQIVQEINDRIVNLASSKKQVTLLHLYEALANQIRAESTKKQCAFWLLAAPQAVGRLIYNFQYDSMSSYSVLSDGIHLNETGSMLVRNLVVDWLLKHTSVGSSVKKEL